MTRIVYSAVEELERNPRYQQLIKDSNKLFRFTFNGKTDYEIFAEGFFAGCRAYERLMSKTSKEVTSDD